MNHCNDFAPFGPSIGQVNSYSYSYTMGLTISLNRVSFFLLLSFYEIETSSTYTVSGLICLKKIIGLRPKLGNTYYHIISMIIMNI